MRGPTGSVPSFGLPKADNEPENRAKNKSERPGDKNPQKRPLIRLGSKQEGTEKSAGKSNRSENDRPSERKPCNFSRFAHESRMAALMPRLY